MKPKRELIRVVRTPGGEAHLDATGKVSGRGAYVCPAGECAEVALKERRLQHALDVPIPDTLAEALRVAAARGAPASGRA